MVLEKEPELAHHQTGHNSGVLHIGHLLQAGLAQGDQLPGRQEGDGGVLRQPRGSQYEICGKVIVAVDDRDLPALERIFERGQANGVNC